MQNVRKGSYDLPCFVCVLFYVSHLFAVITLDRQVFLHSSYIQIFIAVSKVKPLLRHMQENLESLRQWKLGKRELYKNFIVHEC